MDVPQRLWDVKNSRASGKSVEAQKINLAVDLQAEKLRQNIADLYNRKGKAEE